MEHINVLNVNIAPEQNLDISDLLFNVEYINVVGEATSEEEAYLALENSIVDVVLLKSTISEDSYKISEKIHTEYPEIAIVIIEEMLDEDIVHKALFAGANDVLIQPFTAVNLVYSINRSYELSKEKSISQKNNKSKPKKNKDMGKVITIFSTKGGVGKTFIAVNLALALQKETAKRVVLIDLDLDFGSVALALNITPKFTLGDVVDDLCNIDQDLIESYLIPHTSGIRVLPLNPNPQGLEFINMEHVDKILSNLQNSFDYVIVDMPSRLYEPVNQAAVVADSLLMVTTPEIATIRNIKSILNSLEELNYPKSKIKIILNRADSKGLIKEKDIETTLKYDIYGTISVDYKTVLSSLNQGIPVVDSNIKNGLGKEFMSLAKKLNQNSQSSRKKKEGEK